MGGTTSMFHSGAVEAAAGMIVSGGVSSVFTTFDSQEEIDVALSSIRHQLLSMQYAINEARGRRITDRALLEKWSLIIKAYHFVNYYYRTIRHRHSLPLLIESDFTNNLPIRPAKRPRVFTKLVFGDEEFKKLKFVVKMLKSIDIRTFLDMVYAQPERTVKTYLYMEHNRLFNRDKKIQQVMNFLFEPNYAGDNNVGILPIVGASGVGKTSLVLHCFKDPKVQNHFSLKIYVPCVSHITHGHDGTDNVPLIYRIILDKCNRRHRTNDDEDTLLVMLKQELSSERFLLIIDDFYESIKSVVWNALWDCLKCGKQGSKVLFVSNIFHYEGCKKIVNPDGIMPVEIDNFSEEDYMLFFKEHAFGGADPEEYPELANMGREIANKMNGSIWAARLVGELLRDNLNAAFWSNFLKSDFLCTMFSVVKAMCFLLPKCLELMALEWWIDRLHGRRRSYELKTFRELMVLGPDHCTPIIRKGKNYGVRFLVTEHIFLNTCTVYIAICKPRGEKSEIFIDFSTESLRE